MQLEAELEKLSIRPHSLSLPPEPLPGSSINRSPFLFSQSHSAMQSPWMYDLRHGDEVSKVSETPSLDSEIGAFVRYIKPTAEEGSVRKQFVVILQRLVDTLWRGARVDVFGSTATGLHLPQGDIDLVVQLPKKHTQIPLSTSLHQLRHALLQEGFVHGNNIKVITNCKVPIVKFTSSPLLGALLVDISFNSTNGPEGAKKMKEMLTKLESAVALRATTLVYLLKFFMERRRLSEVRVGGLSGMTLFCMIISYFQVSARAKASASDDLIGFFYHYGYAYNYEKDTINTTSGTLVPKTSIAWLKPTKEVRLSIQHPVELNRDLASGSFAIDNVRQHFRAAYTTLKREVSRPSTGATAASILASIGVKMSPDLVLHRAKVDQIWREGIYHLLILRWKPYQIPLHLVIQFSRSQQPFSFSQSPPQPPYFPPASSFGPPHGSFQLGQSSPPSQNTTQNNWAQGGSPPNSYPGQRVRFRSVSSPQPTTFSPTTPPSLYQYPKSPF